MVEEILCADRQPVPKQGLRSFSRRWGQLLRRIRRRHRVSNPPPFDIPNAAFVAYVGGVTFRWPGMPRYISGGPKNIDFSVL